jgi:hypothetical protein
VKAYAAEYQRLVAMREGLKEMSQKEKDMDDYCKDLIA